MTNDTYIELLNTTQWKVFRNKVLERDNHQCVHCGAEKSLQVHHRQYHISKINNELKMPWNYNLKYLITLCATCHHMGHQLYTIQTFIINH
ncbi:MAG: HNH endonuclease [Bacteroidetes bacterium]|nr:HNH endonuclease [Bacteroidota bacterium]